MQKIGFVSIMLLVGLFSLQLNIGKKLKNEISQSKTEAVAPAFETVQLYEQTNRIVFVHSTDSVIVMERKEICKRL